MGVIVVDFDGDLMQDVFVINFVFEINVFYCNLGDGFFIDVCF